MRTLLDIVVVAITEASGFIVFFLKFDDEVAIFAKAKVLLHSPPSQQQC